MALPTVRAPHAIPQDLKSDLIALAILQRSFVEAGMAFRARRAEIEAKMSGASLLARDARLIEQLLEEHNASVRP